MTDVPDFDLSDLGLPELETIELSEDGVARAFVDRHAGELLFDHEADRWFQWQGDHWAADDTELAFEFCRLMARRASQLPNDKIVAAARRASFASGVERFARSDRAMAVTSSRWDQDPWLLGCPGVTIDLRDGTSRPPDPDDGVTKRASVAPEVGPATKWHQFLMEVTRGDEDVIRFLQLWCGYCLTGSTREQVLLFIFGPGGNGKSVLVNILQRLLGDYNKTAPMETFTASRGDRHPTELAMLAGARFVAANETEEGRSWAESKIKALTGGDPIAARFMRGNFFTFKPVFKLLISGNHQPSLRNVDPAIRRRFLILPFTWQPSRIDPDLEDSLWDEAPQILHWAIQGALEWAEEGLPRPEVIREATDDYFSDQDTFGQWLAERCDLENFGDFERAADLFESWAAFAKAAGEREGTAKKVGGRLRRLGLESTGKYIDGRKTKVWMGIRLKGVSQ
ncbi:MAG: phage/plasmid primase, P4 family [Pseudomonadota bacterium]